VFIHDHAQRIRDRPIPDLDTARAGIDAVTRQRGLSEQSRHVLVNMARLALAARDPDQRRVREDDLHQIPERRTALAHALARVGLLQPAHTATPLGRSGALPMLVARSCEHCLTWSGKPERLCKGCRGFAANHPGAKRCRRCRRLLPVADGLCRFCQLVLNGGRDDPAVRDQLWLGGDLAPRLITHTTNTAGPSPSE
jgi:hypothetical protein